MGNIHTLPALLVSKIAAGEVIERPSYAVKELVENSIDAGADYIRIDIENSGLKSIIVTDNGEGMDADDLRLSVKPHTTSKLRHEDELNAVASMGFRGEALSSLAAVSILRIQSKRRERSVGTMIEVREGICDTTPVGMPDGTVVAVEQLFHNVPARKQFMKSGPTEFRHIVDVVMAIALSHPGIRFFLTHNKKTVIDLPQQESLSERIPPVLGYDLFHSLIPVYAEFPYVTISGFIAKPQLSTMVPSRSFVFVNNRSVKNRAIAAAVKDSYGTLLQPHSYPVYILSLKLPHEVVDVNVHPRKEEIRFRNPEPVIAAVKEVVSQTLAGNNLTFYDTRWKRSHTQLYAKMSEISTVRDGATDSYAALMLKDELVAAPVVDTSLSSAKDVLQLHNVYIAVQSATGLVIIDQHAAHERVLYEQLLRSYTKKRLAAEQVVLSSSVMLQLSASDAVALQENLNMFSQLGFDISDYGANTFVVTAVPRLFKDRNIRELISEMIDDIVKGARIKDIDSRTQRMLSYIACRSAIKAGDALTKQQMKQLLAELEQTPNNATCPHGRPTKVAMSKTELNKKFHRLS